MSKNAIINFYDSTFLDPSLQLRLCSAQNFTEFKAKIIEEARKQNLCFSEAELDETFDGIGDRNTFAKVEFGSEWVRTIMRFGWIPKGYSR